jgi:hypothetical protein
MLLMLKHLSARGSLFLFVRSHHQLEYYLRVGDSRSAANHCANRPVNGSPDCGNVIQIRNGRRAASQELG